MSGTEAHEAFAAGNAALADDDFENAIEVIRVRVCQRERLESMGKSPWIGVGTPCGVPRTVLSAQVHSLFLSPISLERQLTRGTSTRAFV